MRSLIYLVLFVMSLPILVAVWFDGESEVKETEQVCETVKVTTYTTDPSQTDSTPYTTASGFKLSKKNPKKHRIIAVSRDLFKKIGFGKKVRLEGTGKYDGIYYVQDLMNKRFRNRIDILINPNDEPIMFRQAKLVVL